MSNINARSFISSHPITFPKNAPVRTNLLAALDNIMARRKATIQLFAANCPEHLYCIDEDKLAAARLLND
ncbi:MAG: hypothetical protein L3J13_06285 [Devosiaceae bacterium]|nr:hypothetical protein [Devosiaceae bacterium]